MAERTVSVRLLANATGYIQGVRTATRETLELGTAAEKLAAKREAYNTLGIAALGFGTAAVAAVGMAAKAAVNWETAWAGVTKTVDGSVTQMAALEDELRGLATTLPATHEEIAAVAEAAGQLGVRREDIAAFTKTMIDLGETTNLTADEAATSIAQLMNVMQTAPEDVDNLGASLVALGNDGASTERDIIQMAQRIAGAARVVGLSEGEVLGFANALASAGIEAEAGGSAISRIMTDIAKSVATGSEDLQGFAEVAGMTAEEFATAFRDDPSDAIATFIEGLGQVSAAGGDVFTILENLGQSDIRVSQALLGMAGAGDLLRESLELGNEAWKENTALQAEAEKRYQTTAAQLQILGNRVNEAAIDFGTVFLPALNGAAEGIGVLADTLADLPEPVQGVIGGLTGVVGVVALVGGAALLAVPKIAQFKTSLDTLNEGGNKATRAMSGLSKGLGLFAGLTSVAVVLDGIASSGEKAALGIEQVTSALLANDLNAVFAGVSSEVTNLGEGLQLLFGDDLNSQMERFGSSINFLGLSDQVSQTREAFLTMGEALAGLVAGGNADLAAEQFEQMAIQASGYGVSTQELLGLMPAYQEALAGVSNEQTLSAGATAGNTEAVTALGAAAGMSEEQIASLAETVRGFGSATLDARDAERSLEAAVDDASAAVAENGATLDINTAAGRTNAAALDRIASSAAASAAATWETTRSEDALNASLATSRERLIAAAVQFGMSEDAAADYADQVLATPEQVITEVELNGVGAAESALNNLARPRTSNVHVTYTHGASEVLPSGRRLPGGYAQGGRLPGPPSSRDNMVIGAASGEFVVNAKATSKHLALLEQINRGGSLRGFASGGFIGREFYTDPGLLRMYQPAPRYAQAPSAGQMSSGRPGANVTIHNYFPQQEPDSEMARRNSELIGAAVSV